MLLKTIREEIENHPQRRIPFSLYMEMALYHPHWGYYTQERQKIGREGDYYTNSSVGEVYGQVWAREFARIFGTALDGEAQPFILVEVGGGDGRFARSVLDCVEDRHPDIYDRIRVVMVERSEYHRRIQKERLRAHGERVTWFPSLQDAQKDEALAALPKIIYSNELFDALPVERVRRTRDGLEECWVEWKDGQIQEVWVPLERTELAMYLEEGKIRLPLGHQLEIPLAARKVYGEMIQFLYRGYIFTVDYGWTNEELLVPHRREGTLMGYLGHRHVTDLYQEPGKADITSHVHFDDLRKRGEEWGLETVSYSTQREWLLANGILGWLQEHSGRDPFSRAARQNRAILQLISPGGMGDTFKVLVQKKA